MGLSIRRILNLIRLRAIYQTLSELDKYKPLQCEYLSEAIRPDQDILIIQVWNK